MTEAGKHLLDELAMNDEVDIETRRDDRSPLHHTTIWIVPTDYGVYVRSVRGEQGRWYQEAVANPHIIVRQGRRKVAALATLERNADRLSAATMAYIEKYGGRYPKETPSIYRESVLEATLRLTAE